MAEKSNRQSPERGDFGRFDDAIGKLLKASKEGVEKKMATEKKTREKRRKAG